MSITPTAQASSIFGFIGDAATLAGGIIHSRQQEKTGDYNARIYEQQARQQRESQKLLEFQKRKILKSRVGKQTALVAKSGIKFSGSPLEVMLDSITNAELDISIDKYNSEVRARGLEGQANITRHEARQRSADTLIRTGTSFLKNASNFYLSQQEIGKGGANG